MGQSRRTVVAAAVCWWGKVVSWRKESLQTARRGKQRGGPPPGEELLWPLAGTDTAAAKQRSSVHPESRTHTHPGVCT